MRARISFEYPQEVLDTLMKVFKIDTYENLGTVMKALIAAELKDDENFDEFNLKFELVEEGEE